MTFVDPEQKLTVDLRVYAIVDPEHAGGHALPDLARMVAAGGAGRWCSCATRCTTRAT